MAWVPIKPPPLFVVVSTPGRGGLSIAETRGISLGGNTWWFVVTLLCIAVISGKFLPPVAIGSGGALGLAWSHGEVWLLDLFSVNDLTTMNRRTYFFIFAKSNSSSTRCRAFGTAIPGQLFLDFFLNTNCQSSGSQNSSITCGDTDFKLSQYQCSSRK